MIRRSYVVIVLFTMVIFSATGKSHEKTSSGEPFCIVALGDSITYGSRPARGEAPAVLPEETFCEILAARLNASGHFVSIINSGIPGNRTDQGILRLSEDVLSHEPDVVLIMYGTNDSCYDKGQDGPRLSLAEYESNLIAMITAVRQAGGIPILMTPPPLKDGWGRERNPFYAHNGANGSILPYTETCRRLSFAHNIPLVDHFTIWSDRGPDFIANNLPDGCHPNAAGHGFLANAILPVLLEHLPSPEDRTPQRGR